MLNNNSRMRELIKDPLITQSICVSYVNTFPIVIQIVTDCIIIQNYLKGKSAYQPLPPNYVY